VQPGTTHLANFLPFLESLLKSGSKSFSLKFQCVTADKSIHSFKGFRTTFSDVCECKTFERILLLIDRYFASIRYLLPTIKIPLSWPLKGKIIYLPASKRQQPLEGISVVRTKHGK
jgi:hypothetical protein